MYFNTVFVLLDIQYTTVQKCGKISHMLSKPAFFLSYSKNSNIVKYCCKLSSYRALKNAKKSIGSLRAESIF